jgi:hypothetical protein
MLVEPLADVEVNVPGVMATLVAPAAPQLSVLLVPEFMLVGFAVKEVIVGPDPFDDELDELVPQPSNPRQTARTRTRTQRCTSEELNPRLRECGFPWLPLGVEIRSLDEL